MLVSMFPSPEELIFDDPSVISDIEFWQRKLNASVVFYKFNSILNIFY